MVMIPKTIEDVAEVFEREEVKEIVAEAFLLFDGKEKDSVMAAIITLCVHNLLKFINDSGRDEDLVLKAFAGSVINLTKSKLEDAKNDPTTSQLHH